MVAHSIIEEAGSKNSRNVDVALNVNLRRIHFVQYSHETPPVCNWGSIVG